MASGGIAPPSTDLPAQDAPHSPSHADYNNNHQDQDNNDASSDDDDATSSSDDEPPVESLVAGRARRANAGNLMSRAMAAEDDGDTDLLFAEEGQDDEFEAPPDPEAAAAEEDDSDSSTSDDDDDAANDQDDDFAGEKELRKQERAEKRSTKRKAIGPQPIRKRVRIADPANSDAPTTVPPKRPKKSERVSWLPTEGDAPTRVSSRKLAVENKVRTLENLKESGIKAAGLREKMGITNARKKAMEKPPMTQEERLQEAARTEKLNLKSVKRWEQQESDRQARQQAELERLRNKKLEGPVIRWYSGPCEWDYKDRLHRIGRAAKIEIVDIEAQADPPQTDPDPVSSADINADIAMEDAPPAAESVPLDPPPESEPHTDTAPDAVPDAPQEAAQQEPEPEPGPEPTGDTKAADAESTAHVSTNEETVEVVETVKPESNDPSFLEGIEEYASLPPDAPQTAAATPPEFTNPLPTPPPAESASLATSIPTDAAIVATTKAASPPKPTIPKPPPRPGQAQTLTLIAFDPTTLARHPEAVRRILLNSTIPNPSSSTSRSAHAIHLASLRPAQPMCAISNLPAKYRDPLTGLPYRDMEAFKVLRDTVDGCLFREDGAAAAPAAAAPGAAIEKGRYGPRWSTLLGAWVGREGVTARNVPLGFVHGTVAVPLPVPVPATGPGAAAAAAASPAGTAGAVKTEG